MLEWGILFALIGVAAFASYRWGKAAGDVDRAEADARVMERVRDALDKAPMDTASLVDRLRNGGGL